MKPKKIDLNQWIKVDDEEDIEGYNGMYIIPKRLEDGTQLPSIYFRRGEPLKPHIEDTSTAIWYKECEISNKGDGYIQRVDWWVESALEDDEYRTILNDTFNRNGFNLKISWEKAKAWLKGCPSAERKTYLHKFFWKWLSKGMQWQLSRMERNSK